MGCDDNNDKANDSSDEEQVTVIEHDFKHQMRQSSNHFEKLLEMTCPNHAYPIRHKLKECTMMKNYMNLGALAKGKKHEGDLGGKATAPFPREEAVMSIYGRHVPHESRHKLKLTGRAVNTVIPTIPEYFRWSESPITLDQTNHLYCIPKLGRYPLVVDPLVRMT
jgi:hypothetical protein